VARLKVYDREFVKGFDSELQDAPGIQDARSCAQTRPRNSPWGGYGEGNEGERNKYGGGMCHNCYAWLRIHSQSEKTHRVGPRTKTYCPVEDDGIGAVHLEQDTATI